jgi:hypothetical protein
MAIEISNKLVAAGSVNGATGGMVSGAGAQSAQSGVGTYLLTLESGGLDTAEYACIASMRGNGPGSVAVEHTSDVVKTVYTFDAAGNAANRGFDFAVFAMPNGISPTDITP